MRIVVSGSSGFLGTKLVARLEEAGHDVVRLVRRTPSGAGELRWDPRAGTIDPQALPTADAVVNLSGANIGDKRWTAAYKRELIESRISATRTLVGGIAALPPQQRPRALLQMSGVDWYGDPGENAVDETASPTGGGFLTEMAQAWEQAAADADTRLVYLRTGLPMGTEGGYLKPLLLPFKLGVGGRLGNGRAWIPWISVPDWLAAVEFLLVHDDIAGPVNLTGPAPVRSSEFAKALGRQLHRPALFPVPKPAMALVAGGQFAGEILTSRRVLPAVLRDRDFRFAHPTIDDALRVALRR